MERAVSRHDGKSLPFFSHCVNRGPSPYVLVTSANWCCMSQIIFVQRKRDDHAGMNCWTKLILILVVMNSVIVARIVHTFRSIVILRLFSSIHYLSLTYIHTFICFIPHLR